MPLYGGSSAEEAPMDDMDMGASMSDEPAAFEPKDDEERAYVEAFPDNAWDENRMAAIKEAVRLCVEKNAGGGYDEPSGGSDKKPKDIDLLVFGAPKKKK
jgi:hypothetical protein